MSRGVVVVGGGVVGLSIARELGIAGLGVTVVDRQELGREASWAGAGMIPPPPVLSTPPPGSFADLAIRAQPLWQPLSEELLGSTGIDNGFRRSGAIVLDGAAVSTSAITFRQNPPADTGDANRFAELGICAERLDAAALHAVEPGLAPRLTGGWLLPDAAQVRNPWHLRALVADCERLGVELRPHQAVIGWERAGSSVTALRTTAGRLVADHYVLATGAWTTPLVQELGLEFEVTPVRGQILLYRTPEPLTRRFIECGSRYFVGRDDGHLLVGSTEELVGFDRTTTGAGCENLRRFAEEIMPEVAGLEPVAKWSGLRPWATCGTPWIGPIPGNDHIWLAAGHFRAGLQLSPITAKIIRAGLTGQSID
ncbi:MAG: FAD-dependent oxidoreductase [Planctomycetaceae bacterium]